MAFSIFIMHPSLQSVLEHFHYHQKKPFTPYLLPTLSSVQSLSRVWLCDPMNCSTSGLPVHHQLPELTQTHVQRVGDAIQPSHPKGDQSWVFIGRTDAKAETPILWSPHAKSWLIGKDPDAGRDWGQEEKGTTEDGRLDGITDSKHRSFGELWLVMDREAWRAVIHGFAKWHDWATELNWSQ